MECTRVHLSCPTRLIAQLIASAVEAVPEIGRVRRTLLCALIAYPDRYQKL
jgi:hypothetical protein